MKGGVIDIVGLRFGKLTVVEPSVEKHISGNKLYVCKCDCGNITIARSDYLRNGRKTSCGCISRVGRLDDLSGRRFGALTVTSRAPNGKRGSPARWHCVCDCGRQLISAGNHLKSGAKTSCGCQTMTGTIGRKNVYEKAFGKLPDDCVIITLDNDVQNLQAENLYAISRDALRIYNNKRGLRHIHNPELKMLAIKTAELELEIRKAEQRLQP